jgi:hypothetical protein
VKVEALIKDDAEVLTLCREAVTGNSWERREA